QGQGRDILEATAGVGSYRGTLSFSYIHNWRFGNNERIGIGAGARLTSFLGSNLYYITAPAILTSGSRSPLILFKENIVENIDSVLIGSPQVNSLNVCVNLEYRFSRKLTAGFNIDAIGFSLGKTKRANYINGSEGRMTHASPTPWNILLISDNDRGSLNSEFYARYTISPVLAIKAGAQFLFTEYTTEAPVQQEPMANDRFRNKALLFALGLTFNPGSNE
ncbi:MAG TPA: hypothetical protein VEB86_01835, partial [Chryseosolibacter sp.]|nr:hypothetical protein [Chryseosolibacter sp.]